MSTPNHRWIPGEGIDTDALARLRAHFRRPKEAMGEAWFMSEERRMFDELLPGVANLSITELRPPLEEIISGTSSFGPQPEWTKWYHYLLAELLPRGHESDYESLFEYLASGFFVTYPGQIAEPYPGYRDDVFATMGRYLMGAERWSESQRLAGEILLRPGAHQDGRWAWTLLSREFSAAAFFCAKYLLPEEIGPWMKSMLTIDSAHWNAQVMQWLYGAHGMLIGDVVSPVGWKSSSWPNVTWAWHHVLRGDYETSYLERNKAGRPFLPAENRAAILRAVAETVTIERYFSWLDAMKNHAELQDELLGIPSGFAEVYRIGTPD